MTIHADVIEPKDSVNQPSYSENYLRKISDPQPKNELFAVGDSVIIHNAASPTGQITRFVGESADRAEVNYIDSKNATRTTTISINRLYVIKPEHRGLKRLDRVPEGVIVGFGERKALVKTGIGYATINYPKESKK